MASAQVEDSWVVVDKTTSGTLRAKASQESLYLSDDEADAVRPRVHVHASKLAQQPMSDGLSSAEASSGGALAPELLDWINNAANESSSALPLANRNTSVSKCSYRTNSSSAGSRQRRTHRRSSVHATSEVSSLLGGQQHADSQPMLEGIDMFNEGMFVVKVVEVKQIGATKPMNIQCVAQVGDERFVIPPVATRPKNYNTWSAKMNDTFVFDVSRQFTFNLGVYGTHPNPQRPKPSHPLASRVSLVSRRHGSISTRNSVALSNDSNPSLLSNSSTRTTTKIKRGLRKIFRNKNGVDSPAEDPAYTGYSVPATPIATESSSSFNRNSMLMPVGEASPYVFNNDQIQTEQATDETGRSIEVQRHSVAMNNISNSDFDRPVSFAQQMPGSSSAAIGGYGVQAEQQQQAGMPQNLFHQHPAFSRLSSYLPRSRTNTTTSAHEINYNGPRLRAFSNASTISSTPQPVGELFLDYKVDRREKRRATFTLPVVNQEQVVMRGGSHVEMAVVLEYGIIVNETFQERAARLQREREREHVDQQHERRQRLERQWAEVDEQDKMPRLRSNVSVFTRSGRVSTWKRYWAVLSCSRILFYDSEDDEEKGVQPVAKISLFHLHDAGIPKSDLVNIGPTGLELHLSPLSMTDRHRRKSAFPRESSAAGAQALAAAAARDIYTHPLPGMERLSISKKDDAQPSDEDDATLFKYSQWQCRVYILLDTLGDRDLWLQELTLTTVPSAEFMRFRAKQRKTWRTEEFESATESLRLSGKKLQVVAAQALEMMSSEHKAQAKKVFADSVGSRMLSMSAVGASNDNGGFANDEDEELEGATLTSTKASAFDAHIKKNGKIVLVTDDGSSGLGRGKKNGFAKPSRLEIRAVVDNSSRPSGKTDENRKPPAAMAFGKPATFNLLVKPSLNSADPYATLVSSPIPAPAKKRLRARRRSSSVADLRRSMDTNNIASSSDESHSRRPVAVPPRHPRRDSGDSTVIEVVGTATERRLGTVSRRFLFVWNINDI
ncbi:hypothetical protein LPJ59_000189 [Coemansia sp. RSA 2399]|nr:hypothetical protein LPJ59_000189 [Coemansia sp. RSA 2399]KAJ1908253.1 hypothetical protein LPJ81_000209 [Coemansia sp. IMI 209127]